MPSILWNGVVPSCILNPNPPIYIVQCLLAVWTTKSVFDRALISQLNRLWNISSWVRFCIVVKWDWKLHNSYHSMKYCDIFHVKEMSCIFVTIFLIRNIKWINNWYNEQHNIVLAYLKWNFWSLLLSKVLTRARIFSIKKHEVWQNIVQYLTT